MPVPVSGHPWVSLSQYWKRFQGRWRTSALSVASFYQGKEERNLVASVRFDHYPMKVSKYLFLRMPLLCWIITWFLWHELVCYSMFLILKLKADCLVKKVYAISLLHQGKLAEINWKVTNSLSRSSLLQDPAPLVYTFTLAAWIIS